ncbi:MAG: hypothetical protein XU12_C0016G0007 [Deltaproteobacteria bacterium CSP1-8]|nr:MAG: hypothetical protein XU12_C0016G0007 [Deltaproteobacteria bacterium CSP1-8]
MGKSRLGKVVALVLVVSVGVVFSAGCFGKFQLTRKVYDINKSVEDKYLRSAVTWLLVIIPVYGLAGFLDFILFNVIEFWSGENPIVSGPQTRVYAKGDDRAVMTIDRENGATVATVARYRAGSLVSTIRIRDDGAGSVTADLVEDGNVVRTTEALQAPDGSVSVAAVSASGTESTRYSASAVETYRARVARLSRDVREALAGAAPLTVPARVPALQG